MRNFFFGNNLTTFFSHDGRFSEVSVDHFCDIDRLKFHVEHEETSSTYAI